MVTVLTLLLIQFKFINLLALLVIVSFVASHGILIYWYRLGDLDPKFRRKLFWDSVNLLLLCSVAITYYYLKDEKCEDGSSPTTKSPHN